MSFCLRVAQLGPFTWNLLRICQLMYLSVVFGRFTARRGITEIIVSDNAKTFQSAAKILRKVLSYPSVKRFLAGRRIAWGFNVDRAPWWGGFFERMIQNVKRCLRKTIRNARLGYDDLHTVLVEMEGTVNSRPLTSVSSDDPEEPLTPSHHVWNKNPILT